MRLTPAAVLLAVHLCGGAALAQGTSDPRAARVDSLFAEYDRTPSPGLALAVVRDGRVLLRRGYGLADVEHRVPITPSTVFDVASLSKQFTGLAVAMLVTEGKVGLRDDIRRYVPELANFGRPITVEQLVHHTSGLRDWPGTLLVAGRTFDDAISFDQILAMAYRQRTLNFVPGAEHLYSNTGYVVLAEMVERVTGRSFRAFTDERIFRPLGMSASHFRDDPAEAIPRRAFGYAYANRRWHRTPNELTALGSSSLFSSVDDMARWLTNLDQGRVGGRALALMQTQGRLNDGTPVPYGFGLEHECYLGNPAVTHSGSWASFKTFILHIPQQRFGIVVLANGGDSIDAQRAVSEIADIYLAHGNCPGDPLPAAATGPTVPVPAATLDAYAGLYRLGPGWYVRIRRQGAALVAQATNEDSVSMAARSQREFWVENYGAAMVFQRDAAGRVSRLDYRGIHAPKLDESRRPPLGDYVGEYESAELGTSYRVTLRGGALELQHRRHGTIPLERLWRDDFGSATWFLRSIEFRRDAAGRVIALVVNGDPRSRDIRFMKRR